MITTEIAYWIISRGSSISEHLDQTQFMQQIIEMIDRYLNTYMVGIFLVDESKQVAVFRAGTGELGQFLVSRNHKIPINETSDLMAGLLFNEIRIIEGWSTKVFGCSLPLEIELDSILRFEVKKDYSETSISENKLSHSVKTPDPRWEILLPLRINNQVFGAIYVQYMNFSQFDLEQAVILQWLTDQIALWLKQN
jgi:hypothetical protein